MEIYFRSTASSTSNGLFGASKVAEDGQINQDISQLASRTNNEQSVSGTRRRMQTQQDGEAYGTGTDLSGSTNLERIAQGGRGFQTSSLDLGVLNRGNVDDNLRAQAGSRSNSGSAGSSFNSQSSHASGSTGHRTGSNSQIGSGHSESSSGSHHSSSSGYSSGTSGNTGNHHSSSNGNAGNDEDYEYEEDYEEDYQNNKDNAGGQGQAQGHSSHSSHSSQSSHSSHSSSRNQGHQDSEDSERFKHYPRLRRAISYEDEELAKALHCNATKCAILRCMAGPLDSNDGALIALRTRLVAHTLHKVNFFK